MTKSLSILGMGSSLFQYVQAFESAGSQRPTDEVIAINSAMYWLSPLLVTRGLAMDSFRRDIVMDGGKWQQYVRNMAGCGLPILSDVADDEWPNVEAYPLKEVVADIWPNARGDQDVIPDLENSICFALAWGIWKRFDEIHLYGCDFRRKDSPPMLYAVGEALEKIKPWWFAYHDREIVRGRRDLEPGEPCTMFLLGVAHQRGIKIRIPTGSTLCNMDRGRYVYGYQTPPDPFCKEDQMSEGAT